MLCYLPGNFDAGVWRRYGESRSDRNGVMDSSLYESLSKILSALSTLHFLFPVFLMCYVSRLRIRASEAFVLLLFSVLFAQFLELILDAWITADHDAYLPDRSAILAMVFYGWMALFTTPVWMQTIFALVWAGIVWGLWYQGLSGIGLVLSAGVAMALMYAFRALMTHRWLRGRTYVVGLCLAVLGFGLVCLVVPIRNISHEVWIAMYMLLGFSFAWLILRTSVTSASFHLKEKLGIVSLTLLGVVAIKAWIDYVFEPFFTPAAAQALWTVSGALPVLMVWQFPWLKRPRSW